LEGGTISAFIELFTIGRKKHGTAEVIEELAFPV
jgi:hypothetical protein